MVSMDKGPVPLAYDAAEDALTAKMPVLPPGITTVIEVAIKMPNGEDVVVKFNAMPS